MASFGLIYENQNKYFDLVGGAINHNQMINKFNLLKNTLIPTINQGISQNDIQQLKRGYIRGYLSEGNEYFIAIFIFSNDTIYNDLFDPNKWAFSYVGPNKANNIDMLENVRLSNLISSGIVKSSSTGSLSGIAKNFMSNPITTSSLTSLIKNPTIQQTAVSSMSNIASSLLSKSPVSLSKKK